MRPSLEMILSHAGRITALLCLLPFALLGEKVDLQRALEMARTYHPRLKAGSARTSAAEADLLTAKAYPNPEFSFLTGQMYSQPPGSRKFNVPVFGFSQPLELGQLRPSRMELARRGVESSQRSLDEVRLTILTRVRLAFYEVLRRDGETAIADESLRLTQDFRDRIRVRVQVGEVGRLELIRAEAEVATARTLAANIRIRRVADLAGFRAAVGDETVPDIEPAGALPEPGPMPSLDSLRQDMLRRNPSLALFQAEVRRAEANLQYQKALKRPQPEFRVEVDNANPTYRMGIAIELPAWHRRQGYIAAAEANTREANHLSTAHRVELLAALDSAYGRYQVSDQEVHSLEQGLLQQAQEAVRAAETAYQLGERGILDVLDAQRVLRTVRLSLLNARHDRQSALVEIDELRATDLQGVTP